MAAIVVEHIRNADTLLREGSTRINESHVMSCYITEKEIVGPAAGSEGINRHYIYHSSEVTTPNGKHYRVLASIPEMETVVYGNVYVAIPLDYDPVNKSSRFPVLPKDQPALIVFYLVLCPFDETPAWNNMVVSKVVVDTHTREESWGGPFPNETPVSEIGSMVDTKAKEVIEEGLGLLVDIGAGVRSVW